MVEVFKTNVADVDQAGELLLQLKQLLPEHKINFDLEDCDKVLRIECTQVISKPIISFVRQQGFVCEPLD